MKKHPFTKAFFGFATGFLLIVAFGLVVVLGVGAYEQNKNTATAEFDTVEFEVR